VEVAVSSPDSLSHGSILSLLCWKTQACVSLP